MIKPSMTPALALFTAFLLCLSLTARATTPTEQVQTTVDAVLEILRADIPEEEKREQVFNRIGSNFHLPSMAKRILATNWRKASLEQKKQFIVLFRRLLVNTYWVRLRNYQDESVEFVGEVVKKEIYARVDTEVVTAEKSIPIAYRMLLIEDKWLAYDVVIEGVSLVQNFRNSYQSIVRNDGIDGLLTKMEQKLES